MLADPAGGCTVVLRPLYDLIRAHLFARCRVPGDDTPLPVLAKDKTATGRAWAYVRDDQRFWERNQEYNLDKADLRYKVAGAPENGGWCARRIVLHHAPPVGGGG